MQTSYQLHYGGLNKSNKQLSGPLSPFQQQSQPASVTQSAPQQKILSPVQQQQQAQLKSPHKGLSTQAVTAPSMFDASPTGGANKRKSMGGKQSAQTPIGGPILQWGSSSDVLGGSAGTMGPSSFGGLASLIQEAGVHQTNAASVREYAYMEDKNFKFRPSMEDTYCIKDRLCNDSSCGLFGVFDGHGGKQVADHVAERLPEEIRKEASKNPSGDLTHAIEQVFLRIDSELRLIDSDHTGSTACIALLRSETGRKVLYVANLGDTRAVLMSGASLAERLSYDHRATDKAEIERVKKEGGMVLEDRVMGSLAITRAFGDHFLKKDGVSAKPHIKKHVLRPTDKYLVMASDGVWDVLEDQDVFKLCRDELSTKDIAQHIIKTAIDAGSTDNCSCMVLRFNSTSPF